jgi:uncharacterized protein YbaR (Trm112 family)
MIDKELLKIMCCPETHQPLEFADEETVKWINSEIKSGRIKNRAGEIVREEIDGGLIRSDKKYLYPVRKGIPIMLIDEAIPLV